MLVSIWHHFGPVLLQNLFEWTQIAMDGRIILHVKYAYLDQTITVQDTRSDMIGVVLWGDADAAKAVIWCEDQGDLAFYSGSADQDAFDICVGDWVSVEIELHGNLRVAVDLCVLPEAPSPTLVEDLVATGSLPSLSSVAELAAEPDETHSPDQLDNLVKNSALTSPDIADIGGNTVKAASAVASDRSNRHGMPVDPQPSGQAQPSGATLPTSLFHRLNTVGGKAAKTDTSSGAKDQKAASNIVAFPDRGKRNRWSA